MWSSKDLALVVLLGVLAFVYSTSTIQVSVVITGIPGIGYLFTIGNVIIFGVSFLIFRGKRWRFFLLSLIQQSLLLFILSNMGSSQVLKIIPMLTWTFFQDLLFNSSYSYFFRNKKLKWFSVLQGAGGLLGDAFFRVLLYPILMPPEFTSTYLTTTFMMLPVILFSGIFGGYIAFTLFSRILISKMDNQF